MVSWSKALKKAATCIGFLIMWGIIGSILIGVGFTIGGFEIEYTRLPLPIDVEIPVPTMANPLAFLAFTMIGYVIIILGITATFFKIMAEITAEEVERRLKTSSS